MGDGNGKMVVDSDAVGETSWGSMETTFLIAFEVTMDTENPSGMKGGKYCIPLTFTLLEG